ncbi:hypothetical protein C6503_16340 [Candidatus Poribacteria bacterium]|nr:MAG: hypothetical protein C6503_16340 [Candidatus Poribacteria bacterium]
MIKARLKQFLGHPITSLAFAGILIYSGLSEIWSTFWEDIRSHHFVIFCGSVHLLKAGLDLHDGKEQLKKFFHPKKEKDK